MLSKRSLFTQICLAHHGVVAGIPSQTAERIGPGAEIVSWDGHWTELHHRSGSPGHQTDSCGNHSFNGGNGGYGETTGVKEARVQSAAFRRYIPLNPLFPPNLLNGLLNVRGDRIRGPGSFCPHWVGGRNGMMQNGGGTISWRWWQGSIKKRRTE